MNYTNPTSLIEPAQLHEQLDDKNLRIFDAAVYLTPKPGGSYQVDSGLEKFSEAHIAGAGFVDLINSWADTSGGLNFTLPGLAALADAIGNSGISRDHRVVLYSSGHLMWATRAWWLLRHAGHTNMAILNGNFTTWQANNLPVESGPNSYPVANFSPQDNTNAFANTEEVQAGMDGRVCTINALTRSLYEGTGEFYYQRRGHIPGSKLLYYDTILQDERLLAPDALAAALAEQGMLDAEQVITYCGGGIAATLNAFACTLMGQENVMVYDGSMSEWVQDPNRPLTEGAQA